MKQLDWTWYSGIPVISKSRYLTIDLDDYVDAMAGEQDICYVFRFKRPYAVNYLKGVSPVCYIGSGRAGRMRDHSVAWLAKVAAVLTGFRGYDLAIARPRNKGPGGKAFYKRVESDLITSFVERFGERPLFNRRLGYTDVHHEYDHGQDLFGPGKGPSFSELIEPLRL